MINSKIQLRQRSALRHHSFKSPCSLIFDLIASKIQDRQRWALRQHFCKTSCSLISNISTSKNQDRQSWALRQNTCKTPCSFSSKLIAIKIQEDVQQPYSFAAHHVIQEGPAEPQNGRWGQLVDYIPKLTGFEVILSMFVLPSLPPKSSTSHLQERLPELLQRRQDP